MEILVYTIVLCAIVTFGGVCCSIIWYAEETWQKQVTVNDLVELGKVFNK